MLSRQRHRRLDDHRRRGRTVAGEVVGDLHVHDERRKYDERGAGRQGGRNDDARLRPHVDKPRTTTEQFPFPVRSDCAHPKWGTAVGNVSTSRGSDEDWAVFSQVSTAAAASTDPWLEILSRSTPGGVIFAMLCGVERLIDVTGDRVMS